MTVQDTARCRCGGRLLCRTPDGRPYWCGTCDAHTYTCADRNHPPGKCPHRTTT
jgi:hypothetical protein